MTSKRHIILVLSDKDTLHIMQRNILEPEGYRVSTATSCTEGESIITTTQTDLMILGDDLEDQEYIDFAEKMIAAQPTLSIILFTKEPPESLPVKIVRLGLVDWLTAPLRSQDVLKSVQRGLERSSNWEKWLKMETRKHTGALEQKVSELETLASVGQAVTAELDLDNVLKVVVEAAVTFTQAEEGSLLLIDEQSGELYMRAARNFQDDFVHTFRLPVEDTLAGGVLDDGEPVFINAQSPQKILTSYLVYSLIYVPLKVHGRIIGVLGVDHRTSGHSFDDRDLAFLSALADYGAIAIENAQLYTNTELERSKLETIITQVEDGVIVLDQEDCIVLVNKTVRRAFELDNREVLGLHFSKVFNHQELIKIIKGETVNPYIKEITIGTGQIYIVQITAIPEVGKVVTLNDITYLKEMDRVKSDFVNAVSHDLRSPLTAILGYVELIERVGGINEQQIKFIRRVQDSVHNITNLIDDLLNLGRIDVGLNQNVEEISLSSLIIKSIEEFKNQLDKKNQIVNLKLPEDLPLVVGDPVQLRQMLDNLLGNATKYTPDGGNITFVGMEEDSQLILQVIDSGIGIPTKDQNRIFGRFYRADNTPDDVQGTGLGLAIVKSIVDNHRGRIWVDSILGQGSTFTVVLPIVTKNT